MPSKAGTGSGGDDTASSTAPFDSTPVTAEASTVDGSVAVEFDVSEEAGVWGLVIK